MRFQDSKYFLPVIYTLSVLYMFAAYGLPFLKYHDVIDWSWWWISLPWWGGMIAAVIVFFMKAKDPQKYAPELEQSLSGNWKVFVAPQYVLDVLLELSKITAETMGHPTMIHDKGTPFMNHGGSIKTSVFHCEAYTWDDNYDQPYNFRWGDLEISWYKHCQRGVSMNREVGVVECAIMLKECLASLGEG